MALTFTPASDKFTCPEFTLIGTDDNLYSKKNLLNKKPFLVVFICNHCPYVHAIEDRLIQLGKDLKALDVNMIAISANDEASHPEDSFENMQKKHHEKKYSFPYLHDASQEVALNFGAVCTPDYFLFDAEANLSWRGRLDDSWKDASKVTTRELYSAVVALLNGQKPSTEVASMGCSIKWKEKVI